MRAWHFRKDIAGEKYKSLLQVLLASSAEFAFVWVPWFDTWKPSAASLASDLRPRLTRVKQTPAWPGNRLSDTTARVAFYRSGEDALPTLLRPGSLFSWRGPAFPEDLSFYDVNGNAVMGSVAHEHDGWVLSPRLAKELGQLVTLERVTVEGRDEDNVRGVG